MLSCAICGNLEDNRTHTVREMMFGSREEFQYLECGHCGCLQLLDVPEDLSKHYPADYYAYSDTQMRKFSRLHQFLRRQRRSYCLQGRNLIGKMITRRSGVPEDLMWLQLGGVDVDSAILDIGCGAGKLLHELQGDGFTNLRGVDPYIEKDIIDEKGLTIWKKSLAEVDQQFDFVMINHAFEHMPDPLDALRNVQRLLKPKHHALVRIPVASCYAWKKYGVDWVQLDAPRHLFLHTPESMKILAEKAGLEIADIFYDSSSIQFWGSEKYQRGIPLNDWSNASFLTEEVLAEYKNMADKLNREGEGDQCGFLLYKP